MANVAADHLYDGGDDSSTLYVFMIVCIIGLFLMHVYIRCKYRKATILSHAASVPRFYLGQPSLELSKNLDFDAWFWLVYHSPLPPACKLDPNLIEPGRDKHSRSWPSHQWKESVAALLYLLSFQRSCSGSLFTETCGNFEAKKYCIAAFVERM